MAKPPILTPQAVDFPRWYQDVVAKAELADNGPVRGTQMIRPWGYAIWERMQAALDQRIKAAGAANVAFPLFIPIEFLEREARHVEGFSPELAVVTHGGGKQLDEPVAVRPTSETLFGDYMAKWIQGHRDLPMLLNQWCNVVRWELRTRLFLRSSEFLWQEGHTAHASEAEAAEYAAFIHRDVYLDFMTNVLACPVLPGRKTVQERFAGAINSLTCEGMMRDAKALQMATSHELGQNFAKAFDITFSDVDGLQQHVWMTSWGSSTRMVGGLIMTHGDDAGLRLPPEIAPVQVVVLAVGDDSGVGEVVATLERQLAGDGVRVSVDARLDLSFGRRSVEWELKGVPVRVEVGPRDLAAGVVTVVRRDSGVKQTVPLSDAIGHVTRLLAAVQEALWADASAFLDDHIDEAGTLAEAVEAVEAPGGGFARILWSALGPEGEAELAGAGISVRVLQTPAGGVPVGEGPEVVAVVGRAY
jgi:prolyl-tRNA synthetase